LEFQSESLTTYLVILWSLSSITIN